VISELAGFLAMRPLAFPFLLALAGLLLVQAEGDVEVTFEDVRDKFPKVYSGQAEESAPKYFRESLLPCFEPSCI
jgi:hypothetical protein